MSGAMSVKAGHGFEGHWTALTFVVSLAVGCDYVGSNELQLGINDCLPAFRALISRAAAVMETHELQMGGESRFFVEQSTAFGTNERTRLRMNSLVGGQSARGRTKVTAVALIRFVDILLAFSKMTLQGGYGRGADGAFWTFEETPFR